MHKVLAPVEEQAPFTTNLYYSEAPPSRAPYPYRREKEAHELIFLMAIMASGIARGRVRTMSRKMAAMVGRHAPSVCSVPLILDIQAMLWSIDTCRNSVSPDHYHVTISRAQV